MKTSLGFLCVPVLAAATVMFTPTVASADGSTLGGYWGRNDHPGDVGCMEENWGALVQAHCNYTAWADWMVPTTTIGYWYTTINYKVPTSGDSLVFDVVVQSAAGDNGYYIQTGQVITEGNGAWNYVVIDNYFPTQLYVPSGGFLYVAIAMAPNYTIGSIAATTNCCEYF